MTHTFHRDNVGLGAAGIVPMLMTFVTIFYATKDSEGKLTLIDDKRAAALNLSKVSGVHFKVTYVDPATGRARHDEDADITVRVGHGQSYAFDGVANAAFMHEVANADNPYPDLERITDRKSVV